jgi:hypothetical protein
MSGVHCKIYLLVQSSILLDLEDKDEGLVDVWLDSRSSWLFSWTCSSFSFLWPLVILVSRSPPFSLIVWT